MEPVNHNPSNQLEWTLSESFKLNGNPIEVSVFTNYLRVGCYSISADALKRIVEQAGDLLTVNSGYRREIK